MTMQMSEQSGQKTAAAKEVAGEAGAQARAVAAEAKGQAQHLVGQARTQLEHQAETRSREAATGLRKMSDQLTALAEGRPQEAGPLMDYLEQARSKVMSLADQLEQRGARGAMNDVSRYARRRPGMFLMGAVGAGFALGRLVRAGGSSDDQDQQSMYPSQYGDTYGTYGTTTYGTTYGSPAGTVEESAITTTQEW
jgi:ElaB/YqjD/DUF883 family membrane-anchored ribosome-binding protein